MKRLLNLIISIDITLTLIMCYPNLIADWFRFPCLTSYQVVKSAIKS